MIFMPAFLLAKKCYSIKKNNNNQSGKRAILNIQNESTQPKIKLLKVKINICYVL